LYFIGFQRNRKEKNNRRKNKFTVCGIVNFYLCVILVIVIVCNLSLLDRNGLRELYFMARILVIEDDAGIRTLLKDALQLESHEVFDACDGEQGAKIYRRHEIDMVITDVFMPEKEGLEVIMELRSKHPDVKIIAISGGSRNIKMDYLKVAENLGANRSFKKPFSLAEVIAAVKELVG
jgi:CheY-like chemotaxis protein